MNLPEIYVSEEAMRRKFWKLVEIYKLQKVIGEHEIFAISNNQRTGGQTGRKRQIFDKLVGVTPGVADYCVPGHGWLEAKRYTLKDGKLIKTGLFPEQKAFRGSVMAKGDKFEIFRTPGEGIDILRGWLEI